MSTKTRGPVFTDDSGHRRTVVQWTARGLCATILVATAAVAVSFTAGVSLPGLERLLPEHRPARTAGHVGAGPVVTPGPVEHPAAGVPSSGPEQPHLTSVGRTTQLAVPSDVVATPSVIPTSVAAREHAAGAGGTAVAPRPTSTPAAAPSRGPSPRAETTPGPRSTQAAAPTKRPSTAGSPRSTTSPTLPEQAVGRAR